MEMDFILFCSAYSYSINMVARDRAWPSRLGPFSRRQCCLNKPINVNIKF